MGKNITLKIVISLVRSINSKITKRNNKLIHYVVRVAYLHFILFSTRKAANRN